MNKEDNDPLIPVFIPALIVLLVHHRKKLNRDLTRDEVMNIRDKGTCIMMNTSHAIMMDQQMGYNDIDPDKCWEQWCEYVSNNPDF